MVSEGNIDHYPLINPYTDTHDIKVDTITCSKTIIGVRYGAYVNVIIMNVGDFLETFNVNVYTNDTEIFSTEVVLSAHSNTTRDFLLNTIGWEKGIFRIKAIATPVEGETNIEDNSYINGIVFVSIPGDLNGDKKVNNKDMKIFNTNRVYMKKGLTWDPNSDINNDGVLNKVDKAILKDHMKEYW